MFNPSRADAGCEKLSTGEDGITGIKGFTWAEAKATGSSEEVGWTEIQDLKVPPRALKSRQHRQSQVWVKDRGQEVIRV